MARFYRDDVGAADVRAAFDYDAAAGQLIWRDADHLSPSDRSRLVGKPAGSLNADGYVSIKFRGRLYRAHRLVWVHTTGAWPAGEIDHVDGDKSNNRFANLRIASRSENMRNVSAYASSKSGLKGTSFDRVSGKWRAQIMLNRRGKFLGRFATAEEAHAAYRAAAEQIHGAFARTA